MSTTGEAQTEAGQTFEERLQRLRLKIDALPEAQRPHLVELAETLARQRRDLHSRVSHRHDADRTDCAER